MTISTYEKNGIELYKVYVCERSNMLQGIRVQKTKFGLTTEAEARREEKKLLRFVYEEICRIEAQGITWKELLFRWEVAARNGLAGKRYSNQLIREHIRNLEIHTYAWLDKRVMELGRADGRYIINCSVENDLSVSSIKKIKGSINKIWTWAVEEGLINFGLKSPVHALSFEKQENKFQPILTLEEIKKLLYEAEIQNHSWKDIWSVAILTGMRSGELYALTWDDVDFDNNIIRITKSYSTRIRGNKSTKNADWRNAHISDDLRQILLRLRASQAHTEFVLPRSGGWCSGQGGRILREFLHRIGIEKYVSFHTLRACFATHTLSSGAEPTQVMKMGGWADFKTFQIYIRMAGVDVKGVTDKLRVAPKLNFADNVVNFGNN